QRRQVLRWQGRERTLERPAQIADRLLHLDAAPLSFRRTERLRCAERQRHAEQPLQYPLVDLARQVEPFAETSRALLLPSDVARGGHQRGGLAERPQQVALTVGELERSPAPIGADNAVRAAGGAQRRAH